MEHEVVTTADMCVTNTPVMRANFIRNNKLTGDNFFTIPNGYDVEDFEGMPKEKTKQRYFTPFSALKFFRPR